MNPSIAWASRPLTGAADGLFSGRLPGMVGRMKWLLRGWAIALCLGCLLAGDHSLGALGTVALEPAKTWSVRELPPGRAAASALGPTLVLEASGTQASRGFLTFYRSREGKLSPENLRRLTQENNEGLLSGSVEKRHDLKDLPVKDGLGAYSVFTDAFLVGQKTREGEYPVLASGLVQLGDGLLVKVSLFTDQAQGPELKAMLAMVGSLRLKPASP
jgi:hypothetical protein